MKTFLIDVGSTFVKYAIYYSSTQELSEIRKENFSEPKTWKGKHFTVSETNLRELFLGLFDRAADEGCVRAYLSVQMHGYLLRNGNEEFSEYVSWRDKSGNIDDERMKTIDFYARGTTLKKNLPIAKLCSYARLPNHIELYTLGSYLAFLLTGRNVTHSTDACASGFYQVEPLQGDPAPFEGLTLPEVCAQVRWVGVYRGMGIYTPVGDHQASFLGSGAAEDKYLLNVGTATQISCLAGKDYPVGAYESRPYFDTGKRLITVSGLLGGAELFADGDPDVLWQQIEEALRRLPFRQSVIFGGGGCMSLYDILKERLRKTGLSCEMARENIGLEGLRILADKNEIKRGTMLSEVAFPNFPLMLKNNRLDFFLIDDEHGSFDRAAILPLLMNARLTGVTAIVRLGDNRRENITRLADAGASGFLLPMTNEADDIAQVVEYAKYAPIGRRGVSTMRAHTFYNPPELKQYMEQANRTIQIYAQLETARGIKNIREILAVPGVDGVMIGPNDLSVDLDCIGETEPVLNCIEEVATVAEQMEKAWGIITSNHKLINFALSHNVNMVSCGSELNMLNAGCKKIKEMI